MSKFLKSLYNKDKSSVKLKKFDGNFSSLLPDNLTSKSKKVGIVFDLETTGLNSDYDQILEISYIKFNYSDELNQITHIISQVQELNEPNKELSDFITLLTGYTKKKLSGKKINWNKVKSDFEEASLIIAHNAVFDRAFLEENLKDYKNKAVWACSLRNINWLKKGFTSSSLELLTIYHGYFMNFHEALEDVRALLLLLLNKAYFSELLNNSHVPFKVYTIKNFPFENKDELRQFRFRWNPQNKFWFNHSNSLSSKDESFLKNKCEEYGAYFDIQHIPPTENFSKKFLP